MPQNNLHSLHAVIRPDHFTFAFYGPLGVHVSLSHHTEKPKMKDLMNALYHTVAHKWKHIGIYLHFSMATLESISAKHQHDPVEMLKMWLRRLDPPATWSAIIETVEFLGKNNAGKILERSTNSEQYYYFVYSVAQNILDIRFYDLCGS